MLLNFTKSQTNVQIALVRQPKIIIYFSYQVKYKFYLEDIFFEELDPQ